MFERIMVSVLIPALLMLAFPQADGRWRPSAARDAYLGLWGQAVPLGTQTAENELFVFTRTAPDEVPPGEVFTVTDEIRAKVELELVAIAAEVPAGFTLIEGNPIAFAQGGLAAGETFRNRYTLRAPDQEGTFRLPAGARGKPSGAASQSLSVDLSLTVTTAPAANQPPIAAFTFSPSAEIEVGENLTFDATASFDPDGTITRYLWDFGDGTTLEGPDKAIVTHAYAEPGSYPVTLVVVDDQGASSPPEIATITVGEANKPPVARFTYSPTTDIQAGDEITFDATSSQDPDGIITNYIWTFGDGTVLEGPDKAVVTHVYEEAGTYTVTLVVVDDQGATSAPRAAVISVAEPPPAIFGVPLEIAMAVGAVVGAVVLFFAIRALFFRGPPEEAGAPPPTPTAPAPGGLQAALDPQLQAFVDQTDLPVQGVTSLSVVEKVDDLSRAPWVRKLTAQSLLIVSYDEETITFKRFEELSELEQRRLDLSPLGEDSLLAYVSQRVSPGDRIVELTWEMNSGETFTSLSVVDPQGRIRFDTFMSLVEVSWSEK